jgi:hypothetical protein
MRKLQNFAGGPTVTSTYAGEASSDYIAAALLSAKTLDQQNVEIHPNVKYKEVIQKIDVTNIVNDATCDFANSGSAVSINEVVLEPKELQVNLELCKQNFLDSWEAISLGYSAFDEIPRNFTDYLISYVGGKVAEATEQSIWTGTNVNGQFSGFEGIVNASSGSATSFLPAQSGSGDWPNGTVDKNNVVDILTAVVDAIPSAVYGKEDTVIYVGTKVLKAWQSSQSGQVNIGSFNSQLNVGEKPLNFQGIEIIHAPGMSDNTIIAGQKSNFHFGTGLLSDYNEVRVLDMADIDGSQNFRVIMRYTAGTQIGFTEEVAGFNLL